MNGETGTIAVAVLFADKDRVHSLRVLTPDGKEFVLQKNEADPRMSGVSVNAEKTISNESASKSTVPQSDESVKSRASSSLIDHITDMEYLAAAESGDEETAGRLVDEAADMNDTPELVYRSTENLLWDNSVRPCTKNI
ncbi:MAG: hypothetical protein K6B40_07110 [Firmicutes bacterium]|nr:hypothetical protein [Bacillota bacterium]